MSNKIDIYWLKLNKEQKAIVTNIILYRHHNELLLRARILNCFNRVKKKDRKKLKDISIDMDISIETLHEKLLLYSEIGFENFINLKDLEEVN